MPESAVRPIRLNEVTKTAASEAIRRSQASARAKPAPAAAPLTAAITGLSSSAIRWMTGL